MRFTCTSISGFQSTLPRGERQFSDRIPSGIVQFQSTLPRGERRCMGYYLHQKYIFQSTLPRGERLNGGGNTGYASDFNPRSREGSDHPNWLPHPFHANFNPRSREGSDGEMAYPTRANFNFNPRSREGSDGSGGANQIIVFDISIHAPARGATKSCWWISWSIKRFQSTLPRGERQQFYLKFTLCF